MITPKAEKAQSNKMKKNKTKSKEIIWSGLVYIVIHLIAFVAATLFVVENFMYSEEGLKSVLFGAFLMLMMVRYLMVEVSETKVIKLVKGKN